MRETDRQRKTNRQRHSWNGQYVCVWGGGGEKQKREEMRERERS